MIRFLQSLLARCAEADGETHKVLRFMVEATNACGPRVLEVGCGYGRFLRPMAAAGLQATGIDINPGTVAANRAAGLACMSPDEFTASDQTWDVILMAHVIEHFSPADLVRFMDTHLDRLQPGGRLIVATPLMSNSFFDDFDHVKPYQPTGIMMVFGEGAAQVQYYARNKLRLHDVWFRRSPLRIAYARGRYMRTPVRYLILMLDLLSAALFLASGRLAGKADGWVAVFEKAGGR